MDTRLFHGDMDALQLIAVNLHVWELFQKVGAIVYHEGAQPPFFEVDVRAGTLE